MAMPDWMPLIKAASDVGLCIFLVVYMLVRQDKLLAGIVVSLAKLNQLLDERRRE